MNYFWAFVAGGAICVVGQLLLDLTALTPARILTGYVVAGVVLSALGWYAPLAEFAGCGATVPLLGCRHHHQPCLRRSLFAGGPQPRPELKQNSSWDDTLFSCIVLFCADSRPLHGILFQKRR